MTIQHSVQLFLMALVSALWCASGGPVHGCQNSQDYADVNQEDLGVKPVTPRKDPKTGFVVGGTNQTSLINKLEEINGIAIGELEKSMRPDELSRAGFLGKDESLLKIMAEDNDWVTKSGLTHQRACTTPSSAVCHREARAGRFHISRGQVQSSAQHLRWISGIPLQRWYQSECRRYFAQHGYQGWAQVLRTGSAHGRALRIL